MTPLQGTSRKRVFFHVGAPKTGTTYLQNTLFDNRGLLAEHGVLYPYGDRGQSFRSMQDFRGVGWSGHGPDRFAGEWKVVADRIRDWSGPTVVVSNELLGGSKTERIAKGLESVGPAEIHVVFSARDFARQLVSDWQEHIKHKHTVTLEKFVDDLIELGLDAPKPFGHMFWGMHDAAYVLGRWAEFVPVDRIHVVTVPQADGPRDALWQRFCLVVGLDPSTYPPTTRRTNPSMGVAETELVRRMNPDLKKMDPGSYDALVRLFLAEDVLGGHSAKLTLPPGRLEWVTDRSHQLIEQLKVAGYHVVGDLQELIPAPHPETDFVSPTSLTDADLGPAAIRAATALLRHGGRQRARNRELKAALAKASTPWRPSVPEPLKAAPGSLRAATRRLLSR